MKDFYISLGGQYTNINFGHKEKLNQLGILTGKGAEVKKKKLIGNVSKRQGAQYSFMWYNAQHVVFYCHPNRSLIINNWVQRKIEINW